MGSESALNTFAKNKSGSSGTFSNPNYKLMQAVSFDPTGSGRRDHVAFVGVSGQNKKGYMWVIDTTKGTGSDCSQQVEIGDFSYMFDKSDFEVPTYSNRSFFNIVAGDFDGDGKESIVVYTPKQTPRNQASGCQIQEWDYDGSNKALSQRGEGNSLLMGYYNDHPWYDVEDSEGNQRRKLGVSMAVGDFNGDCVDDLAVLSYCHRLPSDDAQIDYYRPVVKIVYGTKGDTSSIVTKSAAQSEEFYTSKGRSGGRDRYEFPVGASLTCGDFDGDGDVDLFLAGMLGKLGTWKQNNQQVNETIDMNAGYGRCLQKCFPTVTALRDGLQLLFGKCTDTFIFCHLLLLIVHKVPVLIVSNSLTPAIDNQPNDNHIHLHRKPVFLSCCGSQ